MEKSNKALHSDAVNRARERGRSAETRKTKKWQHADPISYLS